MILYKSLLFIYDIFCFLVNLNRSEREYSISDYLNLNMKHKIIKNITLTGLNNTYKYMGYKVNSLM